MVPPGKENLAKRAESAFKTVYRCKRLQVFLILFWNWCKSTRFYGWCEEMIPKYVDLYQINVDNIVIIAAEFLFEFAQNAQFSIAPNVLVAPFSAIQATLMFLIIGSADPPLNKAFWFLFILFSSCFLHHITAKVFVCTVTCNGSVETKNYGYVGHWLCSDMWSSSPRCP
ncbi:hypothetical protein QR680_014820 [Steinernema hermaphroditum]|uniref:Uncharacterized protein n=1 Tax=Steinernema hermaphroditum TaxID=289476 RepID=A0AA39ICG7_9BILA|nr:hypothetical protein QR680_014820 [Steinernema hermaphroditum]